MMTRRGGVGLLVQERQGRAGGEGGRRIVLYVSYLNSDMLYPHLPARKEISSLRIALAIVKPEVSHRIFDLRK